MERRACKTCAVAKSRCVWSEEGDKCERCLRLSKSCSIQEPAPKRRKVERTSRAQRLDAKLDSIVHLLAANQTHSTNPSYPSPDDSQASAPEFRNAKLPISPATAAAQTVSLTAEDADILPREVRDQSPATCARGDPFFIYSSPPSAGNKNNADQDPEPPRDCIAFKFLPREADRLLAVFRAELAYFCPFVHIADNKTASQLKAERPFLFMTIMMVSSVHSLDLLRDQARECIRYFSEQVIVRGARNLDLLQGLLIMISWYHVYTFIFASQQVTSMLQLAVALTVDLDLTRPQATSDSQGMTSLIRPPPGRSSRRERAPEEMKALAATFYYTSVISSCFKRIDALRYTAYMEEVFVHLERYPTADSDRDSMVHVRLQLVIERIARMQADAAFVNTAGHVPANTYIQPFVEELRIVKNSAPKSMLDQTHFVLQHHHALLCVYEMELNAISAAATSPKLTTEQSIQRSQNLHSLLSATLAITELFCNMSASRFYLLPYPTFARAAHAMVIHAKLSFLDCPVGPDGEPVDPALEEGIKSVRESAWARMPLMKMLSSAAQACQEAQASALAAGLDVKENNLYLRWSVRLKQIANILERGLKAQVLAAQESELDDEDDEGKDASMGEGTPAEAEAAQQQMQAQQQLQGMALDDIWTNASLGFSDDLFWSEVMGDWNATGGTGFDGNGPVA